MSPTEQDRVGPAVTGGPGTGRLRQGGHPLRSAVEWAFVLALAVSVALLVRHYVVQSFKIPSASMRPTLLEGDKLLVSKLEYQLGDVHRGDIFVFKKPAAMKATAGTSKIDDLVKRVIGLPGDQLEARDGVVFVNGKALDEPYLPKGTITTNMVPIRVPIDEFFAMGDNRGDSLDSRWWGTVPRRDIVGKVIFRFFPLRRVGKPH